MTTTYLIIWGAVLAIMLIAELSTLQLVSIWFAAGAAAAFITAFFDGAVWLQMTLFVLVSILLLVFTRPLLKKFTVGKTAPTNSELEIGKIAIVIEEINDLTDSGRVKTGGVDWKAVSADGSVIPKGTTVRIKDLKGTKLYVEPVEEK